ncbi:MAG: putative exonuclease subunit 1 [Prokaryotic dsDNA virus sp.]|nr:MAG: putative exonuclease subunit 1 [Prokaryotic dsDNA virus sp.]|tara:strand:- start:41538 stop:44681 length:3144 start_codon:yes stop_codon:yes gene_type:complete
MTYKIAHFADTHIRNLKYHEEYRFVFKQMYQKLRDQKVDMIVHCGDLAHTKTQLSPEYFALAAEFLKNLADIAPTYIILGNHDGNLKNSGREDAITPIVEALEHPSLHLLKDSGNHRVDAGLSFNVLSIFDRENWEEPDTNGINIALYHGAVMGSTTGTGWAMEHGDDDVSVFKGHDFAMLGDIHKPQILDTEGRVQYAGSTVQQNFSEGTRKGYKLWHIDSKDKFNVQHVTFVSPRPFMTIDLDKSGNVPEHYHIPRGARLRLISRTNLPSTKIRQVTDLARSKYNPTSVTFVDKSTSEFTSSLGETQKMENLRDLSVQERWIREYLKEYELDEEIMQEVLDLNSKYNKEAEKNEEVRRNVTWNIKEMRFENLFNYGSGNNVDFTKLSGIVGIFGRNYSGKSSVIDSALYGLFNTTSKGERKNVHIVNQNKSNASIRMVVEADGQEYQISRNLNKSSKTVKGKSVISASGDLDFHNLTTDSSCNGDSVKDSDKNIRKVFGSIDDFMITSMASQMDSLSFIKEGSTKRKEILAKFLDLEIFDQKFKLAKKDSADINALIKRFKNKELGKQLTIKQETIEEIHDDIDKQTDLCKKHTSRYEELAAEFAKINEEISSIPTEIVDIHEIEDAIAQRYDDITSAEKTTVLYKATIEKNREIANELLTHISSLSHERLEALEQSWKDYNKKYVENEQELSTLAIKKKNTMKKIRMLDNHEYDPDCRFCSDNKFVKDANKAKEALPSIQEEINTLTSTNEELLEKMNFLDIDSIRADLQKHEKLTNRKNTLLSEAKNLEIKAESLSSKVSLYKNELASLKEKQEEYEANKNAIENLSSLVRSAQAVEIKMLDAKQRKERCDKKIQDYLVELGSVKHSIKTIRSEKAEQDALEGEWIAYDLFMRCMHANGIAYEVIKQKLPVINEEIQKCLSTIVDFEINFEEHGRNLDINIKHPNYESRPISMGSGAEKTIAAMAIRLALIEITNLPKSTLFIMDEPATALDQEHMEGFIRLLEMIKTKFKTILLISHLDVLKDCVDTTIDIQKHNGYAKVNV